MIGILIQLATMSSSINSKHSKSSSINSKHSKDFEKWNKHTDKNIRSFTT